MVSLISALQVIPVDQKQFDIETLKSIVQV